MFQPSLQLNQTLGISAGFSGWPVVILCGHDTMCSSTIRYFQCYFRDSGVPVRLKTDGGPKFTSHEFTAFLDRWGVRHIVTSPCYTQSQSVLNVKHLVVKVTPNGKQIVRTLLELQDTSNYTGRSPAQIYGHPVRSCVPVHPKFFKKKWQAIAEAQDAKDCFNQHVCPLSSSGCR